MSKINIQATISADKKKVWEYYTDPKHIIHWNFASDDWCCPSAENDMMVGGKYKARMEAKDKSFGFDFEAIYDEIIEEEKFSYHLGDDRQVDVSFENLGDKTKVAITFDTETENTEERQREGWQAILDNFKKYVETN